jgi:hypothetical protein
MRREFVVCMMLMLLGSAVGTTAVAEADKTVEYFSLPSLAVRCAYTPGHNATLRCDISGRLNPPPERRTCRNTRERALRSISMTVKGRARPRCVGSELFRPLAATTVLSGRTWHKGGFWCAVIEANTPTREGIRCRSAGKHGFFLSPLHWIIY